MPFVSLQDSDLKTIYALRATIPALNMTKAPRMIGKTFATIPMWHLGNLIPGIDERGGLEWSDRARLWQIAQGDPRTFAWLFEEVDWIEVTKMEALHRGYTWND